MTKKITFDVKIRVKLSVTAPGDSNFSDATVGGGGSRNNCPTGDHAGSMFNSLKSASENTRICHFQTKNDTKFSVEGLDPSRVRFCT